MHFVSVAARNEARDMATKVITDEDRAAARSKGMERILHRETALGIQKRNKEMMTADAVRGYGNSMYNYGNHTKGGIHVTHWKPNSSYGGSNAGGASVGGGT